MNWINSINAVGRHLLRGASDPCLAWFLAGLISGLVLTAAVVAAALL